MDRRALLSAAGASLAPLSGCVGDDLGASLAERGDEGSTGIQSFARSRSDDGDEADPDEYGAYPFELAIAVE